MNILKNNTDPDISFTQEELEIAKQYFTPDLTEFPECCAYIDELNQATTLTELANTLNKYTDLFGNGSYYSTVNI